MSLRNIIPPSKQICNSSGNPLSGGKVFLFEPGTTTFVTSYQDSGLITPNTNPVRLSGSGRANIWITRDVDMYIADRNSGDLIPTNIVVTELNANPDSLGADESGGLVPNGSFETDDDSDTVPDSWTLASESGSSNAIDTSYSTDGAQSFRFTSSGSGGGSIVTDDFFPVNDVDQLRVNVDLFSSVAGVHNIVRVEWYDVSQVFISNSDVYDSTANPTTWTSQNLVATPPSGARFAKLRLIGCDPDTATPGSTWFDRLSVFYPAVVSGVFDNITIQDNQIITTNTNGDLEIGPNGTGAVNVNGGDAVDLTDAKNPLNVGLTNAPASNAHIAFDENTIQAKTNATAAATLQLNPLGGTTQLGAQSGTGDVWLYYSGQRRLVTAAGFVHIHSDSNGDPTTPDNMTAGINLFSADNNQYGQIGFASSTTLQLYNQAHGGNITLYGEDSAGSVKVMLQATPANGLYMYYNGLQRLALGANGSVYVSSDGNTDAEPRLLFFTHQNGTTRGYVGHDGAANLVLRNSIHGGPVYLSAEDAGGTARDLFIGDPDTDVKLCNAGTEVARTLAAASGGFQINNTLTGSGFERALTESDLSSNFVKKDSDTTRASTTTISDDPDLVIAIPVAGTYEITALLLYNATSAGTFGEFKFAMAYSGTVTAANTGLFREYYSDASTSVAPDLRQFMNSSIISAASTVNSVIMTGNSVRAILVKGILQVSTTGNLSIQWAQQTSDANGTVVRQASHMFARKVA